MTQLNAYKYSEAIGDGLLQCYTRWHPIVNCKQKSSYSMNSLPITQEFVTFHHTGVSAILFQASGSTL